MTKRRILITTTVVAISSAVTVVALTAVAGYLQLSLWVLVAVLITAAIMRVIGSTHDAFAARSVTFDVTFILFLVLGLILLIPSANLPSPV
ncbi:MAG: hypothetical protein Q4P06_08645 [Actinomycetaceae bacterium]|nr:hypothetical protein [Actinomycetaceae bacterium]